MSHAFLPWTVVLGSPQDLLALSLAIFAHRTAIPLPGGARGSESRRRIRGRSPSRAIDRAMIRSASRSVTSVARAESHAGNTESIGCSACRVFTTAILAHGQFES